MRVEIIDSKTKTLTVNGATYIVYYSAAPYVYIANLRPRCAEYILQVCLLSNVTRDTDQPKSQGKMQKFMAAFLQISWKVIDS